MQVRALEAHAVNAVDAQRAAHQIASIDVRQKVRARETKTADAADVQRAAHKIATIDAGQEVRARVTGMVDAVNARRAAHKIASIDATAAHDAEAARATAKAVAAKTDAVLAAHRNIEEKARLARLAKTHAQQLARRQ
ncbi:hypothetical protein T484DRAFT_1757612, partial [Baffinella frigidus]